MAGCAHLIVTFQKKEAHGVVYESWWACQECGQLFVPFSKDTVAEFSPGRAGRLPILLGVLVCRN